MDTSTGIVGSWAARERFECPPPGLLLRHRLSRPKAAAALAFAAAFPSASAGLALALSWYPVGHDGREGAFV